MVRGTIAQAAHMGMLVCCAAGASLASADDGAARRDEIFTAWREAQANVRSLVVECTLEVKDELVQTRELRKLRLRLLRTDAGVVCATFAYSPDEAVDQPAAEPDVFLINDGAVYLLNTTKRWAWQLGLCGKDARQCPEWISPLLLLLDQEQTRERCLIEVLKQEGRFTCLSVKPKDPQDAAVERGEKFREARVVVANDDSRGVPRNMPLQLAYIDPSCRKRIYTITSWHFNEADAPAAEEFTKPEDLPDWEVVEGQWPWLRPKQAGRGSAE